MSMKRDHQILFQEFKKSGIIWLREGIDGFAFFRNQPVPNITVNSLKRKTTNSREKSLPWDKIVRTFNRLLSEVICRQPVASGHRDLEQSSILYPGFQRLFFFVSTVYFILSIWRTLLWSQSESILRQMLRWSQQVSSVG